MTSSPAPDTAPSTPPPSTVGALARALHASDGQGLEIAIPAGVQLQVGGVAGASVEDGKLRFACLEDRNRAVAADVLAELGALRTDPEALWAAARQLWRHEIGNPDMAGGRLLAAAHPHVDLLRTAASRISDGPSAFDALHLVEAALPHLQTIDWGALIALCDAEQPFTQRDLAGGMFYGEVARWLTPRPGAARELLQVLLASPADGRGNLVGAAWMAWFAGEPGAAAERLLEVAEAADPVLGRLTSWMAGRMLAEASVPPEAAARLEHLILSRLGGADASERHAGLDAATALLHRRHAFDGQLRARIEAGDAEAAAFVMRAAARQNKTLLQAGSFFDWIGLCVGLDQGYEGVLGELDHTLSTLLEPGSPHLDAVFAFLESWVRAHPDHKVGSRKFAKRFDSCTRAFLKHPPLLARLVTQWLGSDELALANAAAGVLLAAHVHTMLDVGFEPALLDAASAADLRFLAKRILGFLIEADQLLSLALSLLRVREAATRVHPMLKWLLYDEIGYDYPEATAKRLRTDAQPPHDAPTQALLAGIAQRLEDDLRALEALPRLRELTVPRALRREFQKARDKQMERSLRASRKQSTFLGLIPEVHIKGGENAFLYNEHQNDFSQPTGFATHSVSFELPRREVLDPVGNTYRRHQLRAVKRGHE